MVAKGMVWYWLITWTPLILLGRLERTSPDNPGTKEDHQRAIFKQSLFVSQIW